MKNTISLIFMFCLIFTLFTACGEAPESPTDAIVSVVESEENNESVVEESSASSVQEESVVSKEEAVQKEPEKTVPSKVPVSSATSKVPATSTPSKTPSKPVVSQTPSVSKPVQNDAGLVPAIRVDYPTFTDEGALKNWLAGKHPDYFTNGQKDMVSVLQSQGSAVYYKPSIPTNHSLFTLSQVEVHTPSRSFDYSYNGTGGEAELVVFVAHDNVKGFGYDDMYDLFKSTYENQEPDENAEEIGYLFQHNNVDFYGLYTPADGSCYVAWQQFGVTHFAGLHGHFDQIEEIIPLLYLQQVKVDNSAVIK